MKVAIVGANGQLGTDICRVFQHGGDQVCRLTHADIDIRSEVVVSFALNACSPDLIINCAAAHNVDACESDPLLAFAVNAIGARNLSQFALNSGASLVHISTDYVFDGRKSMPYVEEDSPGPLNVYGNSKLAGEYFVRSILPRHFVVRISSIYGTNPCRAKGGLNFVERMLKLASESRSVRVVDDEFVTPTPTEEIAHQLFTLTRTRLYGLYHASSEGSCSWYEFARTIFELSGTQVPLEKAAPGEFAGKVNRPKYSVLENAALSRAGLNIFTDWKVGLERYLTTRRALRGAIA